MEDNWRGNIFCHLSRYQAGQPDFFGSWRRNHLGGPLHCYHTTNLVAIYQCPNIRRSTSGVDEEFLARLDEWRRNQPDLPTRPEALRRLAERALAMAPKRGRVKEK